MAVFDRIPQDVLRNQFEYYGLFAGFVPVYVGDPDGECRVAVRNWWPEWLLDLAHVLLNTFVGPESGFMIKITGRIDHA